MLKSLEEEKKLSGGESYDSSLNEDNEDISGERREMINEKLKRAMLEKENKLFHTLSERLHDSKDIEKGRVFIKGHKNTITSLQLSQDNNKAFTGSKDCCIIKCKQ